MAYRSGIIGEIINIAPDEEFITINELANTIGNLLRFNVNPTYMLGRPQDVKLATCAADKARRLLDYKTTVTLRDGLQKTIDFIHKKTRASSAIVWTLKS